ncbi:hypothetical protein [Streptomyces sp. NPDC048445]|uniref:lipoyl protein ligase domain-containing protein n=1 Tax=Streptomyces sp. NPDC048445 TaxID=3365553 RepID=UPI003721D9DA
MVRWVAERKQERAGNRLFLLTHPPVITYTARTPADQLPPATSPISLVEIDRGGHATYHGPGQLIGGLPAPANDPTVRTEGARVRIELDFATRPQFSAAFKTTVRTLLPQPTGLHGRRSSPGGRRGHRNCVGDRDSLRGGCRAPLERRREQRHEVLPRRPDTRRCLSARIEESVRERTSEHHRAERSGQPRDRHHGRREAPRCRAMGRVSRGSWRFRG